MTYQDGADNNMADVTSSPSDESDIKVGDWVSVQPPPTEKGSQPLGIRGCKVLGFGKTADGLPAARLDGGMFGEFNALVAHLELEYRP